MEWICLQTMQQMNMMEGRNFKWSVLSNHWRTGEPFWLLPVCLQGADRFIWSSFHARKYEQQWDHKTCRCTNECISIRLKQRLCQGAHSLQIIYVRTELHQKCCTPCWNSAFLKVYVPLSLVKWETNCEGELSFFPMVRIIKDKGTKMNQQRLKSLNDVS